MGLPTVSLETEFKAPVRLGDRLDLAVDVKALGATSIILHVTASVGGQICLLARLVQVLTDLETMRPRPWPDPWRAAIAPTLP